MKLVCTTSLQRYEVQLKFHFKTLESEAIFKLKNKMWRGVEAKRKAKTNRKKKNSMKCQACTVPSKQN